MQLNYSYYGVPIVILPKIFGLIPKNCPSITVNDQAITTITIPIIALIMVLLAESFAKSTIINAIIGIVIVVIAWSLTVILGQFLGISPNILGNITIGTP